MRKYWPTIALTILFFALLGYIIYTWGSKQTKPTQDQIIFQTQTQAIDSIQLISQTTVTIKKSDNKYLLLIPEDVPADQTKLTEIYNRASKLEYQVLVAQNESNLSQFGLDKPASSFALNLKDGSKKIFQIGNKTPTGDGYYLKEDINTTIYKVDSTAIDLFKQGANDLINKQVLGPFITDNTTKVVIIINGQTKTLEKKDNVWWIDGKQIKQDKANQLIDKIKQARVDGVADKSRYVDIGAVPFVKMQAYVNNDLAGEAYVLKKDENTFFNVIVSGVPIQYYITFESFEEVKGGIVNAFNEATI